MNLATIERMVLESDLSLDAAKYLINCKGECEWLDYKEQLHLEDDYQIANFTKDMLAMKNVGGGYLVVGVKDKTWELLGLPNKLPYDTKMLRDKVRRGSGLELEIDIVHHKTQYGSSNFLVGLIHVRASRKRRRRRSPSVVAKDFCSDKKFGLRSGDIYLRSGDSTVKMTSSQQLESILDNLEFKSDKDFIELSGQPSPFAVTDGLYRLLDKGFEEFIGREDLRQLTLQAVTRDPRLWIINVHGPGGVGKSALVNWITYDFYRSKTFEAIIHLSAKETALNESGIHTIPRSLYSFENLLDHILSTFEEPLSTKLDHKRSLAVELLSAWKTLLVLDNMETLHDGRILDFVQDLPNETKAKVLLTSRQKTGGWEYAIPVTELNGTEVYEFLKIKSREENIDFPLSSEVSNEVMVASGGLPLAIQWILGQYKMQKDIQDVLKEVRQQDSPILEFSFRNIWNLLPDDARSVLAAMPILDGPTTLQELVLVTSYSSERVERALSKLEEVTLVRRTTQQSDGSVIYTALPITLSFARNQLDRMEDFEVECRRRYSAFNAQTELRDSEAQQFKQTVAEYGLTTDNEKKAAILCRRAASEAFTVNLDSAEILFVQARELAPQSAYVYAMSARFELDCKQYGPALRYAAEASKRSNKKTGWLCYTILAEVHDQMGNKSASISAFRKALTYDPYNDFTRHQLGVILSKNGDPVSAVEQFTIIINSEKDKRPIRPSLLVSLSTRILNYRRLKKYREATTDIEYARQILAENPHLTKYAHHITDLE